MPQKLPYFIHVGMHGHNKAGVVGGTMMPDDNTTVQYKGLAAPSGVGLGLWFGVAKLEAPRRVATCPGHGPGSVTAACTKRIWDGAPRDFHPCRLCGSARAKGFSAPTLRRFPDSPPPLWQIFGSHVSGSVQLQSTVNFGSCNSSGWCPILLCALLFACTFLSCGLSIYVCGWEDMARYVWGNVSASAKFLPGTESRQRPF